MRKLLSEREIEAEYGISVAKLQDDRLRGRGIPYCKLGKMVRYRREDIENYLLANRRGPVIPSQARCMAQEGV